MKQDLARLNDTDTSAKQCPQRTADKIYKTLHCQSLSRREKRLKIEISINNVLVALRSTDVRQHREVIVQKKQDMGIVVQAH